MEVEGGTITGFAALHQSLPRPVHSCYKLPLPVDTVLASTDESHDVLGFTKPPTAGGFYRWTLSYPVPAFPTD
ncbi:hypothetical protein N7481_012987 [Penicillium waksmanii]|uniref:uncharacterized protein n=1 Tax=Penicillium waksmanii TaxID=69791 RepID=UPI002547830D|nr:uncharacterized protein N7481_012987 [Penicillium waksmanii]KAJ5966273.1 hypothetical protein N7481_012987 [Penicillium waksmanii]